MVGLFRKCSVCNMLVFRYCVVFLDYEQGPVSRRQGVAKFGRIKRANHVGVQLNGKQSAVSRRVTST